MAVGADRNERPKSKRVFHDVLGSREKSARVYVTDDPALAWVREHLPDAVTEWLDKKALKMESDKVCCLGNK